MEGCEIQTRPFPLAVLWGREYGTSKLLQKLRLLAAAAAAAVLLLLLKLLQQLDEHFDNAGFHLGWQC